MDNYEAMHTITVNSLDGKSSQADDETEMIIINTNAWYDPGKNFPHIIL